MIAAIAKAVAKTGEAVANVEKVDSSNSLAHEIPKFSPESGESPENKFANPNKIENAELTPLKHDIPKFDDMNSDAPDFCDATENTDNSAIEKDKEQVNSSETPSEDDIEKINSSEPSGEEAPEEIPKGLSDAEKLKIKEETGWSDEIVNHIDSMDQYEIYKNADLHEEIIDGKPCLVKNIDWDYVDPKTGKTNKELAAEGKSPIDAKTGEKIELHHMGQDKDGPFVELTENTEHGDGNHGTLHPDENESWRHEPGAKAKYNTERVNHWKERAEGAK